MKILITGANGFIGGHLKEQLSRKYATICSDIGDNQLYDKISESDVVMHLGAITDTQYNGSEMMRVNYDLSVKIFMAACEKKVIFTSSAAIYGNFDGNGPVNVYGWSKYAAEQYGLMYHPNFVSLRLFNVYGPGEKHKGRMASVASQILTDNLDGLIDGAMRDFVYVKDVVSAFEMSMDNEIKGAFDVGTGKARSFKEVFDILDRPYKFIDPSAGFQKFTQANPVNWVPGWSPQFDLESGLDDLQYRSFMRKD